MDLEERIGLVKGVAEEIITEEELYELLASKQHPLAYDGFEPSGFAHLPFGVFRPLLLKDLMKAGFRFKLLLADWHAWLNNKMGGDLQAIRKVGEYFVEVWRAAGVDLNRVEIVWASDLVKRPEYWEKVLRIAKSCSVARATRALTIMGRKAGELREVAQYFYPMMQVADIFELGVDVCQLGLDQRRANVLAREIAEKLKWKKPVVISHHMLMGLQGLKEPEGFDTNQERDIEIASKMSKSKPQTCIFVHDSREDILKKLKAAYCPPKDARNNPILEYAKYIIFRAFKELEIKRKPEHGGDVTYTSYSQLESDYRQGKLHPLDLKLAVAEYLDKLIEPIRKHFERNKKARELYNFIREREVTR
ncbi:MAG: tyrosine--tRNA ligase [Candidatus Aenigmatarchaeota archaeon]|nr:MAG: tyrosine--tRNA ligase [Candidatus Aenigmarchaeota archaeon]